MFIRIKIILLKRRRKRSRESKRENKVFKEREDFMKNEIKCHLVPFKVKNFHLQFLFLFYRRMSARKCPFPFARRILFYILLLKLDILLSSSKVQHARNNFTNKFISLVQSFKQKNLSTFYAEIYIGVNQFLSGKFFENIRY